MGPRRGRRQGARPRRLLGRRRLRGLRPQHAPDRRHRRRDHAHVLLPGALLRVPHALRGDRRRAPPFLPRARAARGQPRRARPATTNIVSALASVRRPGSPSPSKGLIHPELGGRRRHGGVRAMPSRVPGQGPAAIPALPRHPLEPRGAATAGWHRRGRRGRERRRRGDPCSAGPVEGVDPRAAARPSRPAARTNPGACCRSPGSSAATAARRPAAPLCSATRASSRRPSQRSSAPPVHLPRLRGVRLRRQPWLVSRGTSCGRKIPAEKLPEHSSLKNS